MYLPVEHRESCRCDGTPKVNVAKLFFFVTDTPDNKLERFFLSGLV
jgi:hypothetical protein